MMNILPFLCLVWVSLRREIGGVNVNGHTFTKRRNEYQLLLFFGIAVSSMRFS